MKCFLIVMSLAIAVIYIGIVSALYFTQRQHLYHPVKAIESPDFYGLKGFTDTFARTEDGVAIQLWYHPPQPGFPTVVYYHGNGGNLSDRIHIYAAFVDKGFGVLGVSYRGYGKSGGTPTEQGIYTDARTALHFLTVIQHIPIGHILLFGESLGTGVAVEMAVEYKVGGVILESPYTSIADRAAELYPYVPVKWLLKDRFDTIHKIGRITSPLLLLHGERDPIIPIAHGKAVFAAAPDPKEAIFLPDTAHNDFDSGMVSAHVLTFAQHYHLIEHLSVP